MSFYFLISLAFVTISVCSKICYNLSILSTKKKVKSMGLKKILLYKIQIKYYLSDKINALFKDFALSLQNVWTNLPLSVGGIL